MPGCRRFPIRASAAAPGRTGSARPSGRARRRPGLSPLAAARAPPRSIPRSRKSPRARTNSTVAPPRRCRRAARRRWRRRPHARRAMRQPAAPAPPPAPPDFSSLERHLIKITSQIEALQRPDHIEQSIAAFRSELAEIRHAITEAMPRRAIESLENEIRSLSHRIDDNRQNGTDGQALAGIERALTEIREVLRTLTPAEQLAGYDEAIRNLGAKLDLILRANDDPSTVQQLEGAIAALRAHRLQCRLQRRAGAAVRGRADAVVQGRPARPRRRQRRCLRGPRTAHRRADLDAGKPRTARRQRAIPNSSKTRCARCRTASTACRSATTAPRRSPISNSACRICSSGSRPPRISRRQSRPRRGRAAGHPAPSRTPARQSRRARRATASSSARRRRWIPAWSTWSSANCPTSASASPRPTAARRIRSKPCTTRSAMWSIASR